MKDKNSLLDYEALRLENMKRNAAQLKALGFDEPKKIAEARKSKPKMPKKKTVLASGNRRTSARLANVKIPEEVVSLSYSLPYKNTTKERKQSFDTYEGVEIVYLEVDETPRTRKSCTVIKALPPKALSSWIGCQLLPKGKRTIMLNMCSVKNVVPGFAVQCGSNLWKNASVLYINLHNDTYDNHFTHLPDGRVCANWYASSSHTMGAQSVAKLLECPRGDSDLMKEKEANSRRSYDHNVHLFCRSGNGPYLYLGPLGYLGHVDDERPILFHWQILHASALPWEAIKKTMLTKE